MINVKLTVDEVITIKQALDEFKTSDVRTQQSRDNALWALKQAAAKFKERKSHETRNTRNSR